MTKSKNTQVKKLSPDQARKMFDRQAKHYLNISGSEFIKRWDSGKFNGSADTPDVMRVAMLLPFGR